jgi:hypothetical protein
MHTICYIQFDIYDHICNCFDMPFPSNGHMLLLIELLVNINKPRSITFTVPIYNVGKFIGFFNLCSNNMDKSWMTKPRISKEYIDGCKSFVDFAVLNCRTPDGLLYCLCKACCLNKRHNPALVFDHLTGGKGMSPQYKEWIYHGEPPVRTQVEETNLPRSAVDAGPSTEDVGGNMQAMLRDLFGVHDVREDSNEPQLRAEGGEEHVSDDTPDRGDA